MTFVIKDGDNFDNYFKKKYCMINKHNAKYLKKI